jgi:Zn-dependent peptidase ImmA (M78 family)
VDDTPRIKHARELARAYLKKHGVTKPPTPVEEIIAREQLRIVLRSWGKSNAVGALLFRKQRVVALNSDHPKRRQRFSLAHELGHYAFHHDAEKTEWGMIDIDNPPDDAALPENAATAHHGNRIHEQEANAFASEILVPKEFLLQLRPKKKQTDEAEESFNRPFAALAQQRQQRSPEPTTKELAGIFEVSEDVMVLALGKHGSL